MSYKIKYSVVQKGFDGKTCWFSARGGAIPSEAGGLPVVMVTAQPALLSGTHIFFTISEWRTHDMGKTWDGPAAHGETLGLRSRPGGVNLGICDMTPAWHAATRKLLLTGQTVLFMDDMRSVPPDNRAPAYAVYDPASDEWGGWETMQLPERPDFAHAGAGSAQRHDKEDGSVLLPLYFRQLNSSGASAYKSTVAECSFDGKILRYERHGTEVSVEDSRGAFEPSLTRFRKRYYLTLRNDLRGYVTAGDDGLHFEPARPWRFDDGSELGNYNTQQHWVTHDSGLFLVYTRRGLNNDNVFRHRAPLMMARVDPEKLLVIRDTEHELIPNRGARLGNFGVSNINNDETWVFAAEFMKPSGCEKYGSDNTIWAARIIWE